MRVCVLVLGDVGRSPRMCFHALSLAQHRCYVDLLGYHASSLPSQLQHNQYINKIGLRGPPRVLSMFPSIIGFAFKFVWLFLSVLWALMFKIGKVDVLIMQNPPGVPTLAAVALLVKYSKVKLVIDWHNYSYSVLRAQLESAKLPKVVDLNDHLVVRLCRKFEWNYGASCHIALCVSRAMRADIEANCGSKAVVLYDRPPHWKFAATDIDQLHSFVYRLATKHYLPPFVAKNATDNRANEIEATSVSYRNADNLKARWRQRRPAVVVSSTSWTVDEDFRLFLDALVLYNDRVVAQEKAQLGDEKMKLPPLIAVITGKGPEKAMYMRLIQALDLRFVDIVTPWLETVDYPLMLQIADLGVCLHTSTSGLDLPMKVVDMFGCSLPVLAKDYSCIGELVRDGVNGHVFDDGTQLARLMTTLLQGFPGYSKELNKLRQQLRDQPLGYWEDNWDATVWPLLTQITAQS